MYFFGKISSRSFWDASCIRIIWSQSYLVDLKISYEAKIRIRKHVAKKSGKSENSYDDASKMILKSVQHRRDEY